MSHHQTEPAPPDPAARHRPHPFTAPLPRRPPSRAGQWCCTEPVQTRAALDKMKQPTLHEGVHVVEEPHDEVFGRTFVVTDPDANLIRVSPVD